MTTSNKVLAIGVLVAIVAAAFYFLQRDEGRASVADGSEISMDAGDDADVGADQFTARQKATYVPGSSDAPGATAAMRPPVVTGPVTRAQLPAEFRVLYEGQMDVREVLSLVKGAGFDDFLGQLERQSRDSPLAQDIDALFDEGLRAMTNDSGSPVVLQRLACGMKVCAGRFDAPDEEGWQTYLAQFRANKSLRIYTYIDHGLTLDNGTLEKRIVFSTDPSANRMFQRF